MTINIQKQNIKTVLVVVGIAILVALGIFIFSGLKPGEEPEISQPPTTPPQKELSPEARELRDKTIANPEVVSGPEDSKLTLYTAEDKSFDVSYIKPSELFIIFIYNKSPEDFDQKRKGIEEYFVNEILKTDNLNALCELNVIVYGYKYSKEISNAIEGTVREKLSFCGS